jgi:zinc protease
VIHYTRWILDNGLRVLVHEDHSTPMAAVAVLYDVGSKDEQPDKTGFAHLFEHLMFGGSANIPDFDEWMQKAGGEDNAFTNNDITNFYELVPAENLEVALWLESDRMLSLNFSKKSLDVQRKVVIEEFKETCLNEPYGDVWHHLSDLAYKVHPYRWPVIGLVPEHIAAAKLSDVEDFFFRYYRPNNAVLVVSGKVDTQEVRGLVEKWFGNIPPGDIPQRTLPQEPRQEAYRRKVHFGKAPVDALYMAFHIPGRAEDGFYPADLLSDILCNGPSSRLFRRLYKEQKIFSQVDSYVVGQFEPGLLLIEGKLSRGVSLEQAEAAVWKELSEIRSSPIPEMELQKWKNKAESNLVFSELTAMSKALNLAYFEALGDADRINYETDLYNRLSAADIQHSANEFLCEKNCNVLHYTARS